MNFDDALLEARGSTPVENVWAATTIVSPNPSNAPGLLQPLGTSSMMEYIRLHQSTVGLKHLSRRWNSKMDSMGTSST